MEGGKEGARRGWREGRKVKEGARRGWEVRKGGEGAKKGGEGARKGGRAGEGTNAPSSPAGSST